MDYDRPKSESSSADLQRDPVQLDLYGIKLPLRSEPEPALKDPGTWLEVAAQIHDDLKAIAGGLVRLVRITLESVSNIVAGLGGIPSALEERIAGSHHRAAHLETLAQDDLDSTEEANPVHVAQGRIEAILTRKRIQGYCVGIALENLTPTEPIVVYLLKPGTEELVPEIVSESKRLIAGTGGLNTTQDGDKPRIYGSISDQLSILRESLGKASSPAASVLDNIGSFALRSGVLVMHPRGENFDFDKAELILERDQEFAKALDKAFGKDAGWMFTRE